MAAFRFSLSSAPFSFFERTFTVTVMNSFAFAGPTTLAAKRGGGSLPGMGTDGSVPSSFSLERCRCSIANSSAKVVVELPSLRPV